MPRHGHKASRRESRALACAAVAAPWLMVGLVCSLQPAQALWLLRLVLLAAVATLQPLSPPISDNSLGDKPKRKAHIGAGRPPIPPLAPGQSDIFSSSRPQIRSRASKALSSNKWLPQPLSTSADNYCSNSATTSTTNSSTAGKGNSNSNMQSATATTSSHSNSGTSSAVVARSCFGAGNSGGWDDSDEGGSGGERPRFQAVKSHSLDAPDSAAVAVASSSKTTPANSRTNSSSHCSSSNTPGGSVPSICDTVPSGDMPLSPTTTAAAESELSFPTPPSLLSTSAAVPSSPQVTAGPWTLNSPYSAAMTPFDSSSSASRNRAAAPAAAQPQQQQAVPHQGPTTSTGPWKLSSPFAAAPLPAFSCSLDDAATVDATWAAKSPKKKALPAADAIADSKQHQKDITQQPQQQQAKQYLEPPQICVSRSRVPKQQQQQQQSVLPKCTTGPWALHSPFIAAATPPTLEVVQEAPAAAVASSSSQPAVAAPAVADPFGSPLPAQFGQEAAATAASTAGLASSTPTTAAAGARGNTPAKRERRKSRVGIPTMPPSPHTGPWALFSPFAAAVAAEAAPDCNAQQQQTVDFGSNSNADQSAAAAVVKTARSGSGSSVRAERSGSGAGSASSTPTAAAGGSRGSTPAKRERRKSRLGIPTTPPSPHTGPWALFSPFAAAVAAEAAPDRIAQQQQTVDPGSSSNADQAAAAAVVKTARSGSGGTVRSDRSGSSNLGQLPAGARSPAAPGQLPSSRDSSSDRLADGTAVAPGSLHSASEPRHSLAFSFPSVGISASNADTSVTSAVTSGGFDDCLDLDLQPTPMASMFWGGEGLSPVPSESELVMSELDDAKAAAAAGDQSEIKQQQQRMRHVRGGRLHDSAHSHMLQQHKVPIVAVQQQPTLINPVPAAVDVPAVAAAPVSKATTGPWALHSPFAAAAALSEVADNAPMAAGVSPVAHPAPHPAGGARSGLDEAAAAGGAVYLDPAAAAAAARDPMLLAPAPPSAVLPARIKTPVLLDATAPAAHAAPSSPSAPAAAEAAAVAAAAATRPKNMSCLCCYPPSLTEGQSTEVHVYITGLDLPLAAAAADAMLRAVVVRGSVIVADYTGICRPSDGLFRVPVPALPNGPLQLLIFLGKQLCFTQPLLVLPGPSAQEMILLWGSLLQSHLALQQQQQQQQILTRQQGSRQGSMAIRSESIGSGWNSQGSASSDGSGDGGIAAAATTVEQQVHTAEESTGADGGVGGSWMGAPAQLEPQQQGGSLGGISSVDVQTVWQRQYTPVLTDIAYLLSAQLQKAAVSPSAAAVSPFAADGSSPRSMAAAAAGQSSINMETPKFKSMVTHLVQFLAANGLWAVLQLITDSVYGVGASAKALYTAKAATSAAASGAASVQGGGGSSGASSSGAAAAAAKVTQATQTATAASAEIEVADPVPAADASSSEAPAAISDPAAAVAAAVAAVEAGQSLDLSAVLLLLLLAIRTSTKRGLAHCRAEGFVSVLQRGTRAVGSRGRQLGLWVVEGAALLVLGLLWVYDALLGLVVQVGKGQAGSASPAVAPEPVAAAAASLDPVAAQGP